MHCIMAGMYQKDRYVAMLFVEFCSGMCKAGNAGSMRLAMCSFSLSSGPRCSASWPV